MTIYAVALTLKDPTPFLAAWQALDKMGISTQLNQNITPHYGLAHGKFDDEKFSAVDFWQKLESGIDQAALGEIEVIYDAPFHKDNGSLLARPYFPFGGDDLIHKTQTAIMIGFGWTEDEKIAWARRGRHTTLGTSVNPEQISPVIATVHSAWKNYTPIITGFDGIALYRLDDQPALKFTELFRCGFGS